jgi:hypothetical protein
MARIDGFPPLALRKAKIFFNPIQLHFQPPDLLVQTGDQCLGILFLLSLFPGEQVREILDGVSFPPGDQTSVNSEGGRQLRRRSMFPDRLQRHLGFKFGRITLTFHGGSLPSFECLPNTSKIA